MKNILCYGDSNTWGCIPGVLKRYDAQKRWTGVAAKELGAGYNMMEDGINGRSTVWNDPANQCRNGLEGLGYALYRAKPLDLVVVMLGTNDLNYTDAEGFYEGLRMLTKRILAANEVFPGTSDVFATKPQLLLVSPIALHPTMKKYSESLKFAYFTEKLAGELDVPWLDGAAFAEASELDGCHMDEENHARIGKAIARKIKQLLG